MAKCDLSIELEEPDRLYTGGDVVRGVVTVQADSNVRCKALEIQTIWATHGRGNVDRGTGQSTIAYEGEWQAGQTYRYPFQLQCARWPPSYHGHYLNVDHYVEARAQIPWAFDPKASVPFRLQAVDGPEAKAVKASQKGCGGAVGGGIIGAIALIFLLVMLINPFLWILGALFGVGSAVWWFIFRWMPSHRLGPVQYQFASLRLAPGQTLRGELTIQPPRPIEINEVTLNLSAKEVCVSGSGSNKTTHRHTVFEKQYLLATGGMLPAGTTTRWPIEAPLPSEPIYSLDLSDNDLTWTLELRINVPRWPDWKRSETLIVVPPTALQLPAGTAAAAATAADALSGELARGTAATDSPAPLGQPLSNSSLAGAGTAAVPRPERAWSGSSGEADAAGITFEETIGHIWSVREDDEQAEMLVEAVRGLSFPLSAIVERRLLYDADEPLGQRDGHVVWARYPDPPMPLTLYVPRHLGDDFEQAGRDLWHGQGTIIGYDRRHNRVQVQVESR